MNEELKVIISAEIGKLQNELGKANKQVGGFEKKTKSSGGKVSKVFAAIGVAAKAAGKVVTAAFKAITAAITAGIGAIVAVSAATKEYRDNIAKLNTAYEASGSNAKQAAKTYNDLFRFLGDSDTATEAANLLAKLTTNEQELAEWTTALQGVYATFPDSLPIESLAEAANETAKVGKVTGTLADALNWAGVSEDAFNNSLAATNSEAEREALIRNTLNSLYSDAALKYEENNKAMLRQNEAKARLTATMAKLAKTLEPVILALTNLANTFLSALAPAINAVVPYLVTFINYLSLAVQWIAALFGALSGKGAQAADNLANNAEDTANGFKTASTGANKLNDNLGNAAKTAEKIKKSLAGFDELNVLSGNDSSSSSGSGGAAGGGIGAAAGGVTLDTSAFEEGITVSTKKVEEFANKVKGIFNTIKGFFVLMGQELLEYAALYTPTFEALAASFTTLFNPFKEMAVSVGESFWGLLTGTLMPFYSYLVDEYIPGIVNAVTVDLAPLFTDVMAFAFDEFAKDFQWICDLIDKNVKDIIVPSFELVKDTTTDATESIAQEWARSGTDLVNGLTKATENIRNIVNGLYEKVIKPITQYIIDGVRELWDKHLSKLWKNLLDFFTSVGEAVLAIWNNFLAPILKWIIKDLVPPIVEAVKRVIDVVKTVIGIVSDVVGGILKALSGLLDFITGVFTGKWDKAWAGLEKTFDGIWDAIWGIVKGAINLIIDGLNALWSGIYGAVSAIVNTLGTIAEAAGDLLGKDWGFSMPSKPTLIPKLATGGIVDRATLALIGERGKEAVLPLENNTEWMDKLAAKIGGSSNAPSKIVLMLDGKELGWASINSINDITKQTGNLQLTLV